MLEENLRFFHYRSQAQGDIKEPSTGKNILNEKVLKTTHYSDRQVVGISNRVRHILEENPTRFLLYYKKTYMDLLDTMNIYTHTQIRPASESKIQASSC